MGFVYGLTFLITSFLLVVGMACQVIDAFHPRMRLFRSIKPYLFIASLAIFPVIMHFFGMFIDYSAVWEFLKGMTSVFGEIFRYMIEFVKILIYIV